VKIRLALLAALALTAIVSGCRLASGPQAVETGGDTVDATLPTQLPRTAIPSHYAIEVTPHADRLAFDGKAAIDLRVIKPTRELVLAAFELGIHQARLTGSDGRSLPAKVVLNSEAQTASFQFDRELAPGAYRLDIIYSGKINTVANGLFALDYTNVDGKRARALYTQFEAADERRFVPSWNEPDYKATFDLSAVVPASDMAVGNMPAASSRDLGNGLKRVVFETTPVMSSYLLFFATGDFERIASSAAGHEVGVVTSRGNGEKARFALDSEAQILPYYNAYFGRPYPLPKLDNVAAPGEAAFFGAMENWGAIFTFERDLLVEPAITSEAARQDIFGTEAHEMAHMWFGDLVTMGWWDELWLNEGFANWMANRTTQHFHPDWGSNIDQVADREKAMGLDSFATTHPVVQSVRTVEQANQAFDNITYDKGESIVAMLEDFAGAEVWRQGIRNYMARFAYRNTRSADLWAAMETAGAKGLTKIATDFTTQPGIPLVRLGDARCINGRTLVAASLTEFSNDRREQASANPLTWHIPIRATAGVGSASLQVTEGHRATLNAPGCGVLIVNPGQSGYFRVLYTPQQSESLRRAFHNLAPVDQYGVLSDAFALSDGGYQPVAVALDLLAAIPAEAHAKIAQDGAGRWVGLFRAMDGHRVAQAVIRDHASRIYWPRLQELGFRPRSNDSPLDALLRESLIADLGEIGEPHVVAEGQRLLAALQTDPNAVPGSLKTSWLGVVARNADARTWNALHRMAATARSSTERSAYYQLLGLASDERLARQALNLAISNEPGATVSAAMITSAAENHATMTLDFVLSHLAQVTPFVDLSGSSGYVAELVQDSADATLIPRIQAYAAAHIKPDDRRPINHAVARIKWKAAAQPRMQREIAAWLKAHPVGQGG